MAHKLAKYYEDIRPAVDGTADLRENQKVYKKVYKYYKDLGVHFTTEANVEKIHVIEAGCATVDHFPTR